MSRPLSPLEHLVWLIDQGVHQNFVMVARVSGVLTELVLRQALNIIQQRHPSLRSKIKGGRVPEFLLDDVPPIPLRIVKRNSDLHWVEEVEKEMCEPLPWSEGPLIRVIHLVSGESNRSELLVTFCHVTADATSGVTFVEDLLTISDKLSKGMEIDLGSPLQFLPAPDNLLREDLEFRAPELSTPSPQSVELPGDVDVPPDKRVTRVIQKILSPDETKELVRRCREEKTSVHGALCAAFMQAMVEQMRLKNAVLSEGPYMMSCVTPVNMRHHFSISVDKHIGDFISQAIHYQFIDDTGSLWDDAREVREALTKEINAGGDIQAIRGCSGYLAKFSHPIDPIPFMRELFESSAPVAATNLGRLDIPEQFGDIILEELHFTVSINADAKSGFAISVTTFRGRLTINFLYAEPYISKERANRIIESTMKRLLDAIS